MKLGQKLLLIIMTSSLVPLMVVGLPVLLITQSALRHQIQQQLTDIDNRQLSQLNNQIDNANAEANNVAFKAQIRLLLEQYEASPSASVQHSLNLALQDLLNYDPAFARIHILNLQGQVIASTDTSYIGKDYKGSEVFAEAKTKPSVGIFFKDNSGALDEYLGAPLVVNTGTLGVILVEASASRFLLITGDYTELGQSGESYLVRKTASGSQQYLNPLRFNPSAALTNANQPIASTTDYRGHTVLLEAHPLENGQWTLITKIDRTEVLAPISRLQTPIIAILALSFVTMLIIAFFFSRSFTVPIRILTQKAREISMGNLRQRITLTSRDEIGTLAATFNTMTDQLASSYKALEEKVAQRTVALNQKVVELASAKAKDDAILGSIGEGLIVTDTTGNVLLSNPIAIDLLALNTSDVLGMNFSALPLHDEQDEPIPAGLTPAERALKTSQKIIQGISVTKTDKKHILNITATPVLLNREPVGVIQIIRDITKEREVDRMKTEFISLASHQLRTPLSAIKWFSEMLLAGDGGALNPEQTEFAQNISSSTARMIQLVSSLLNISRIESGRIIIAPVPTDLHELIDGIVNDLQGKTQQKQQTLVVSVHKELPKVSIDPQLIGQVYLNLLTNAIKYTPAGGTISVFVSRSGDELVSQVTDNGYGIPKAQQEKVFQKFFRAENAVKVETDGTGLGLYLIKAIVDSSGGKIWFKSEEGKGTSFWFTLPMSGMRAKKGEVTIDA